MPTANPMRRLFSRQHCAAAVAAAVCAGCVTTPAPEHPRAAQPLPPEVAARFALPGPVATLHFAAAGGDRDRVYWRGALRCGDEVATFHVLQPRGGGPRPLVVCLPILAGGAELMWLVASGLVERGYAAAWVDRVASAMRGEQRAHELEQLFRRTVLQYRMLLRWAERRADLFRPGQVGLLGISTGGIVGTVVLALEPDVAGGALCLAGADLPRLLLDSLESRVVRWRRARATREGLAGRTLLRELQRELTVDPAHFGAFVDTERVFLVHAALDDVVPPPHQDRLWESLGRPRRLRLLLLGHYSAGLFLDAVLDEVAAFLAARLAAVR